FSGMKAQAEQKKKELFKKMEAGGLNEDEEEWLDNEGNMVDEFLLMERLKEITPNNQHIPISASDIEIIKKISLQRNISPRYIRRLVLNSRSSPPGLRIVIGF
ncbi:hypothetical protein MJO29_008230, partial [Puccinia striiformis f. sp. tritici]